MIRAAYENKVLGNLIASWAAMIAGLYGAIIRAVLAIVEDACNSLHELESNDRRARQLSVARSGLSQVMTSKLEIIGLGAPFLPALGAGARCSEKACDAGKKHMDLERSGSPPRPAGSGIVPT